MSSFDRYPGLSTKKSAGAMSFVPRPAARHEPGGTFVDSWTLVMQGLLATCGNMRKFVGVLKRWQRQMQQKI